MLKFEKEYQKKYGEISCDKEERISSMKSKFNQSQEKEYRKAIELLEKIEWGEQTFTIFLSPKGTPRPRYGKHGVFYVKGAKDNRKYFEKYLIDKDVTFIKTPTIFKCKTYFPIPQSMTKVEKVLAEEGYIRPITRPDWDNLAKTYCDMIQGFTVFDDAIIVHGETEKYYSSKPRIEITLRWMKNFDSSFNKKKIEKIFRKKSEVFIK